MLTFGHGPGLSMQNTSEYAEISYNGRLYSELIDIANAIGDTDIPISANSIILEVGDEYLFDKLEQLINSYEYTEVSVVGNHVVANVKTFHQNTSPSTIRYNHFYQLYWYIRTALVRNLLFASVSNGQNSITIGASKYIIRNPQSISIENGK